MGELPLAEIEFRLALLPPISRSAHLAGPKLHAERLIELWKADGEVALAEAFRLLDVATVAGVILRTVVAGDYDEGDPHHWLFPRFADLLLSLREAAWQEILAGKLGLEAIKGVTGRQHRPLAPGSTAATDAGLGVVAAYPRWPGRIHRSAGPPHARDRDPAPVAREAIA